jgi:hypothetical protein
VEEEFSLFCAQFILTLLAISLLFEKFFKTKTDDVRFVGKRLIKKV